MRGAILSALIFPSLTVSAIPQTNSFAINEAIRQANMADVKVFRQDMLRWTNLSWRRAV